MTNIKLVASDIDGTLLFGWSSDGIDGEVFEQIRELRRRGVLFLASSGRQYANLRRLFAPVADDILYLCENGSLVIADGQVIVKQVMERGLALELCHQILDTPGCDLLISGERVHYVMAGADAFADHMRNVVGDDIALVDEPEDIAEDIIKVSYRSTEETMRRVRLGFEERFGERLHVTVSGMTWLDVMPKRADKGSAMAALGKALGIGPAETMAFGDNLNDAEMLQFAGHPYLIETGNQALLGLNDRIRTCAKVNDVLRDLLAAL